MSYHLIHVAEADLSIRLHRNGIIFSSENGEENRIPAEDIAAVICGSFRVTLTGQAIKTLADNGAVSVFIGEGFKPVSWLLPTHQTKNKSTTESQFEKFNNETFCKNLWLRILQQKIDGQNLTVSDVHLGNTEDEAVAARKYWKEYFKELGSRAKTRRQGTENGLNGLLDYAYTILTTAVCRSIIATGLVSTIGVKHKSRPSSQPLAYDLVEPIRPVIDTFVMKYWKDQIIDGSLPEDWKTTVLSWMNEPVDIGKQSYSLLEGTTRYVSDVAAYIRNDRNDIRFISHPAWAAG